jgi:hypothetical protein
MNSTDPLGGLREGEARKFNEEKCCRNEVGQQRVSLPMPPARSYLLMSALV